MTRHGRDILLALWALLAAVAAPACAESFYVPGSGGVPLAVTVAGPPKGPEILFIHGLGMGGDSFAPQMESELAARYRMVAFDLRGHGMSGKPWCTDDYTRREVWAEDVARVIAATGLRRPVIVGWSYGTLVAADYLSINGPTAVSGLVLVSALGGLVTPTRPAAPDRQIVAQLARSRALRASPRLSDQKEATRILAPLLYEKTPTGPSPEWEADAASLGLLVPPYAQPHLRAHLADNLSLTERLKGMPVLVVHGTDDLGMMQADVARLVTLLPKARSHAFEGAGHSPFAEHPAAFNAVLAEFVNANWEPADDR